IITDIISIATIEAGQEKLRISETDINNMMNDLCQHYRMVLNNGQVEIIFHSALTVEESKVMIDGTKLAQVISNLVDNAIKFTEKGSIKVECTRKSEWLHFSVQDTGIGIPEKFQQVIFERFRQVDNDKEVVYRGNGLGLAISKAYVELMEGIIGVRSEPSKGSCFYFSVPYRPVVAEVPVEEHPITLKDEVQPMEKDTSATEKLLLIAEDEESNFILTEKMLAPYPYRIIHVTNGQAAIDRILEYPAIDMVLMDLKMPGVNGYEATCRIRELRPDMPIVAVTAYALSGDREKALEAGCNDYLPKPFDRHDLIAMIEKFTAKPC
ncbi:MAG TPA: ATP-binding protein, partial [Bacteroidales bacterium]|nr:ATP-binding protein [Bacteroidales bacterium]